MHLVEIETRLGKEGELRIPKMELEKTGLCEGDEICLLYLTGSEQEKRNNSGEFILEKR